MKCNTRVLVYGIFRRVFLSFKNSVSGNSIAFFGEKGDDEGSAGGAEKQLCHFVGVIYPIWAGGGRAREVEVKK